MKKVKQIWFDDEVNQSEQNYRTGLVLELEDGTLLQQNSTDYIQPFSVVSPEASDVRKQDGAHANTKPSRELAQCPPSSGEVE